MSELVSTAGNLSETVPTVLDDMSDKSRALVDMSMDTVSTL